MKSSITYRRKLLIFIVVAFLAIAITIRAPAFQIRAFPDRCESFNPCGFLYAMEYISVTYLACDPRGICRECVWTDHRCRHMVFDGWVIEGRTANFRSVANALCIPDIGRCISLVEPGPPPEPV